MSMIRKGIAAILVVTPMLLAACSGSSGPRAARSVEVGVVTLRAEPVTLKAEQAGRTVAVLSADVRPQVSGIVRERLFTEGGLVKAGEVLFRIDAASYRAAYAQAAAALINAEAAVRSAQLKDQRYAELLADRGVSQQDADDAHTAYQQAVANVAEKRAAADSARINLQYTELKAPIAGRIGKSNVTPGALVTANQADALATIRALDPMYVDFTQSSVEMLGLRRRLRSGTLEAGGDNVSLMLEDGTEYGHRGQLQFSEVAVDESTGSVTLRATFPNPQDTLLPGMYVRAIIDQGVLAAAILAPQAGITRDPKGGSVALVVGAADKVEQRAVVTERSIGDRWLVSSGLRSGDRLIVQGTNKVKAGDTVRAVEVAKAD